MREQFIKSVMPVLDEINHLVRTAWALQQKRKGLRSLEKPLDDSQSAVEFSCLMALHRETISSLCRLDDGAKEYMSLRHATEQFLKTSLGTPIEKKLVAEAPSIYREKINRLKVHHRNSYIAHLTKRGYENQYNIDLGLSEEMRDCILALLPVVDALCGTELNFVWPVRNSNELINLRWSLEHPEHWNAALQSRGLAPATRVKAISSQTLGVMKSPHYLEAEGMWMLPCPEGTSCEVLVNGSVAAPDASRLALVQSAMFSLKELQAKAVAYLDGFVDRQKFGAGEWYFEGIESGRLTETEDQLSMAFTFEADVYGYWVVTIQASSGRFYPVAFSRRQS
jgi:hypothetical protein